MWCASGSWDLEQYGLVYALAAGPYGAVLALSWNRDKEGQPTHVALLSETPGDCQTSIEDPLLSGLLLSGCKRKAVERDLCPRARH